ncbi:hypothetical protein [Streptomyces alboflavus]|uniref:hypothetical protein n=1 Tax=Streptomyces alboflavus TaxID=67267 RepID=UPI0013315D2E|nr:hypothetical protein [Streptomyces alboflavus]
MTLWVAALALKNEATGAAEEVSPVYARASATVREFSDLFPLVHKWRGILGEEITVFAMSTLEIDIDVPAHDTHIAWDRFGPEIRIDTEESGELLLSDVRYGDNEIHRWDIRPGMPLDVRHPDGGES